MQNLLTILTVAALNETLARDNLVVPTTQDPMRETMTWALPPGRAAWLQVALRERSYGLHQAVVTRNATHLSMHLLRIPATSTDQHRAMRRIATLLAAARLRYQIVPGPAFELLDPVPCFASSNSIATLVEPAATAAYRVDVEEDDICIVTPRKK